jgi:NitT/TauT family transport system substrate-binding protein
VTLPKWPAEANRASIEALMKLGEEDGLFKKTPDLDALLP